MAQDVLDFKVNIDTANAATNMETLGTMYDEIKNKMEKDKITPQIDLSKVKSQVKEVQNLFSNAGKDSGKKIDLSNLFTVDSKSFDKAMNSFFSKMDKQMKNRASKASKDQSDLAKLMAADKVSSYPYANELNAKNQKLLKQYSRQNVSGENRKNLETAMNLQAQVETYQKRMAKSISDNNLEAAIADYNKWTSSVEQLNSVLSILGNTMEKSLDTSDVDTAISKVEKYRDSLKNVSDEQNRMLDKITDRYNQEGLTRSEKLSADRDFQQIKNEIAYQNKIADIQREASSGKYSLTSAKADTFLSKYNGQNSDVLNRARAELDEYKKISEEVIALSDKKTKGELIDTSGLEKSKVKLEECGERMKNVLEEVRVAESKTLDPKIATSSANSVQKYMNDNTKALKKYKAEFESVRDMYKNATTVGEKNTADVEFKRLKSAVSAEGLNGKGLFGNLRQSFSQLSKFSGVWAMAQGAVVDIPRQIMSAVTEINSAQIELRKVSSASDSQLSQYWDQAAESAKKYGATVSDVISSTADWSRLGYGLDDAKELSDMTTLLSRVGDNMTQESSSEGLISTLRGFKLQANDAKKIVDVANQVANTEPIDTAGIFEAMQRSASSLEASGNTYEQAVAMTTAANSVVQDSMKIGTGLKTISMRIRSSKTEIESAGLDTEGMATSTAKLRKEIKALSGVDIMKNANEFKSTYDILDELAEKWSSLTDIQQASVTELIAGKNQGNIMSAMMSQWDVAKKTLNTALNESDGSAEKELDSWNKGIEASIEHFKASFQSFSSSLVSSDFVKGIVDSGSSALDVITQLIDKVGLLKTAFATFAGVKLFKNLDLFYLNWSLHTQEYNENGVVNKCVLLTF